MLSIFFTIIYFWSCFSKGFKGNKKPKKKKKNIYGVDFVVGFCIVSTFVCNRSHIFLNYEEGNPGQLAFQFCIEVYACGDTNCMLSVALLFDSLLAKILYVY